MCYAGILLFALIFNMGYSNNSKYSILLHIEQDVKQDVKYSIIYRTGC